MTSPAKSAEKEKKKKKREREEMNEEGGREWLKKALRDKVMTMDPADPRASFDMIGPGLGLQQDAREGVCAQ
jgi:hypothetical protein